MLFKITKYDNHIFITYSITGTESRLFLVPILNLALPLFTSLIFILVIFILCTYLSAHLLVRGEIAMFTTVDIKQVVSNPYNEAIAAPNLCHSRVGAFRLEAVENSLKEFS